MTGDGAAAAAASVGAVSSVAGPRTTLIAARGAGSAAGGRAAGTRIVERRVSREAGLGRERPGEGVADDRHRASRLPAGATEEADGDDRGEGSGATGRHEDHPLRRRKLECDGRPT